jgi:peptide deformylase
VLRKKSREVTVFDTRLHQLLEDMADTMQEANGVGLAAVQVGVLRRAVTLDVGEGIIELINPAITERSEEEVTEGEGCLSYPGEWGLVSRPKRVTVTAQDRHGDLISLSGEDLLARAICHEVDHLDGAVFMDIAIEMVDEDELEDEE